MSQARIPHRRRRPALSCLSCRQRKIKCDRNDPCGHCTRAHCQCIFRTYRDDVEPQSTQTMRGSRRDSNVVGIVIPLRSTAGHHPSDAESCRARAWQEMADSQTGSRTIESDRLSPSAHSRSDAGEEDHTLPTAHCDGGEHVRPNRQPTPQILLSKNRILGWSHKMAVAEEFSAIGDAYMNITKQGHGAVHTVDRAGELNAETYHILQECKALARTMKVERPSRNTGHIDHLPLPPPRAEADLMKDIYIQTFESTFRILHWPSFLVDYLKLWDMPRSLSIASYLKILLVLALGSSVRDAKDNTSLVQDVVHHYVFSAQKWLSGPLEKDRLTIDGIQIYCLLILARQVYSIGGDLTWMSMGSLIHRAMQMGLHRDPKCYQSMSVLEAETRRRLWATILELNVQSALDSAMPPRISIEEYDTEPPANVKDGSLSEATLDFQAQPRSTWTSSSVQLLLLDSLPLRLRIVQKLNGLHTVLSFSETKSLSIEILRASRANAIFVHSHRDSGASRFHQEILDYLVNRFLLPLNSSYARRISDNPDFQYAVDVSLETAMAILSPTRSSEFMRLMIRGGGMFREGFRYAYTPICIEILAVYEANTHHGTVFRSNHKMISLKSILKDDIEISAERIRQGETNIKSHLFLSTVLGQVQALESGIPIQLGIARSAKDSVEFCREILSTRAAEHRARNLTAEISSPTYFDENDTDFNMDQDWDLGWPELGFF